MGLHQSLKIGLCLKTQLRLDADVHQNIGIVIPEADAIQIACTAFIVDDERRDIMSQTFLEHDQPSDASVAILVRTDALELHMKIQYVLELYGILCLILLDQTCHRGADLCRRSSLAELLGCSCLAVSNGGGIMALMLAVVAEQLCLKLIDERLGQRLHSVGQDRVHAEEMITRFHDIIDLDGFAVGEDLILLVKHLDLIAGKTVACHATVAVDHVDLQILIESSILFAVALLEKLSEQGRDRLDLLLLSCGLLGILRNIPCFEFQICMRNTLVTAVIAYHSLGYAPFFCRFFGCNELHFLVSFQLIFYGCFRFLRKFSILRKF